MIRNSRNITLFLIIFFAILTGYLTLIKPKDKRNSIMIDSFGFSSKKHDTLVTNYPISDEEIKEMLFTVHRYSNEYGGEGFIIGGIDNGESIFHRKFELKDSTLVIGNRKIYVGDTYDDIVQYKPLKNIFKIETNKLSLKNEGFIRVVTISNFSPDQQTIKLKEPVLLITGKSNDSYYIKKSIVTFYKTLPYILIILGLTYYLLTIILKIKNKTKLNH
jgi:hypothetical protein